MARRLDLWLPSYVLGTAARVRARLGAAGRACATASHTWRNNAEQIVAAHAALAQEHGLSAVKARS